MNARIAPDVVMRQKDVLRPLPPLLNGGQALVELVLLAPIRAESPRLYVPRKTEHS
jgi:hypothetical protein